jgi:AcrR family transcriptional regulator
MPSKNVGNGSTQEKILQESMRLFLEKGYHGTSIDDITRAAGLTKGALYWHFKNKEELLKRIVEEFEKRFLNNLILAVGEVKGGVLDKFEKYIRFNSAFAYYNRELCVSFETLAAELVGAHDRIEPEFRRIYQFNLNSEGGKTDEKAISAQDRRICSHRTTQVQGASRENSSR